MTIRKFVIIVGGLILLSFIAYYAVLFYAFRNFAGSPPILPIAEYRFDEKQSRIMQNIKKIVAINSDRFSCIDSDYYKHGVFTILITDSTEVSENLYTLDEYVYDFRIQNNSIYLYSVEVDGRDIRPTDDIRKFAPENYKEQQRNFQSKLHGIEEALINKIGKNTITYYSPVH